MAKSDIHIQNSKQKFKEMWNNKHSVIFSRISIIEFVIKLQ